MAKPGLQHESRLSTAALVLAIHRASINNWEWPEVLKRLRVHLDASVVMIGHHEFVTGTDSALFESTEGSNFIRDMACYSARNPWFLSSEDYFAGRVMTGDELISHSDLRRTDFFRGFLQPRGLLHLLCGVINQHHQGAHFFAAFRAEGEAPFDSLEKAELGLLLGHITLSLKSQWRWQETSDMVSILLALSAYDDNPAILVTADGELVHHNRAAQHLLQRHQGLCLDGKHLRAESPADLRLLRDAIASVAQEDQNRTMPEQTILTLASIPPMPPVVLLVRAAGQIFRPQVGSTQSLVLVNVRGGHGCHEPATCMFARQYSLTAAQTKVSGLVFAGQSLSTIARSLHLSEHTVRSHLKQIFQKTDTHGQMELVHLHARACTTLL